MTKREVILSKREFKDALSVKTPGSSIEVDLVKTIFGISDKPFSGTQRGVFEGKIPFLQTFRMTIPNISPRTGKETGSSYTVAISRKDIAAIR